MMKKSNEDARNIVVNISSANGQGMRSNKKKNKLNSSATSFEKSAEADFWKFRNHNPKDPHVGDFSEFALGRTSAGSAFAALKWAGAIQPRPRLAKELMSTIQEHFLGKSSGTGKVLQVSFRAFWRFLDSCTGSLQVSSLSDLTDLHGAMMCSSGFVASQFAVIRRVINLGRQRAGLTPLYWTIPERSKTASTAPETQHIKAIHHYLISQVFDNTFKRWEDADKLALSGSDWSTTMSTRDALLPWSDADRHATYRGLAVLIGDPCPMPRDTGGITSESGMGIKWNTPATQPLPPILEGMFPGRDDVVNLIHLFMIRTGWNASTVLNIDASDYVRPHPTSPEHHVVHAIKVRSSAEQFAIGQNKSERSPGNLLKRQIERTEPLRVQLRCQLSRLKTDAKIQPYSDSLALDIASIENMIRSPWIYFTTYASNKIGLMDGQSLARKEGTSALHNVIRRINSKRDPGHQIPTLRSSDFRDAFIGFAHARNGHIWFIAMLAGQHRSPRSSTPYLSHLQNKTQAWETISNVSNAIWKEIKERRVADPAILRFLVANGEISEEQRVRWQEHKSLTRVGMGCRDSKSPPNWLAPGHREGETCRVQRCTLCHNGILVEGSVDFLSRRKAELLHTQLGMGMAAWEESTFPVELQGLQLNLEEYDAHAREERLSFWAREIKEERHRVPTFVGSYA